MYKVYILFFAGILNLGLRIPVQCMLEVRIDGFDTRVLCTMEGIQWHQRISNTALRECTQQLSASCLELQHRMRWFGHIQKCPPEGSTYVVLDFDSKADGW